MFRIEMLPAAHGDCLWVEWTGGNGVHRMLIDGGPAQTYPALRERILHLPASERHFELLVVTHIDADHIEGIVRLLQDAEALHLSFERIWFNGRDQLNQVPDPAGDVLGALQGEYLGMLISELEQRAALSLINAGLPVAYAGIPDEAGDLPVVELPGNLKLTLLSPDCPRLLKLKDRWRDELAAAGFVSGDVQALRRSLESASRLRPLGDVLGVEDEMPERFELPAEDGADIILLPDELGGAGAFGSDQSAANGSSIAFLAEHPDATFLLTGDAFAGVLAESVTKLLAARDRQRLKLDGFKVPHHGSVGNLSEELLQLLDCRNYLVSTSGAVFRHPDARAIELLINHHAAVGTKLTLYFNYLSTTTQPWSGLAGTANGAYNAAFPKGISLDF